MVLYNMLTRFAPRLNLWLVCAFGLIGSLYIWFAFFVFRRLVQTWFAKPVPGMGISRAILDIDFSRFYYAGSVFIRQRALELGLTAPPAPDWTKAYPHLFSSTGDIYSNWIYPPPMDVVAMLAATIPLPLSFLLWDVMSLVIAASLLRAGGLNWAVIIAGLAGTASIQNLGMGQNGIITGSIFVTFLLLLERRPLRAGALAGLLCIKPHLGLLLPAVLLHKGRSRALVSFVLAAMAFCALSVVVVGLPAWRWYLSVGHASSSKVLVTSYSQHFLAAVITPFFMSRSFGGSLVTSFVIQACFSTFAFCFAWQIWRKPVHAQRSRVAATLCLSCLVSPYGNFYDLVGFSVAMASMAYYAPDWRKPFYAILWLAPGYSAALAVLTGHVLMPIAALAGLIMVSLETKESNLAPAKILDSRY